MKGSRRCSLLPLRNAQSAVRAVARTNRAANQCVERDVPTRCRRRYAAEYLNAQPGSSSQRTLPNVRTHVDKSMHSVTEEMSRNRERCSGGSTIEPNKSGMRDGTAGAAASLHPNGMSRHNHDRRKKRTTSHSRSSTRPSSSANARHENGERRRTTQVGERRPQLVNAA